MNNRTKLLAGLLLVAVVALPLANLSFAKPNEQLKREAAETARADQAAAQQRQQGKKVTFTDFGTFLVRKREPAAGSYPKTKPNELKSRPFKPPPCAPANPSKTPSDLKHPLKPAKQAPSRPPAISTAHHPVATGVKSLSGIWQQLWCFRDTFS